MNHEVTIFVPAQQNDLAPGKPIAGSDPELARTIEAAGDQPVKARDAGSGSIARGASPVRSGIGLKLLLVFVLSLMSVAAPVVSAQPAVQSEAAAACPSVKHRTLRLGNTGKSVKHAQCLLNFYWGENLKVDGIYGKKTRAAVIRAQRAWEITPDGIVGRCTWRILHAHVPPAGC